MATKKQKQELIDILKFSPVNVRLLLQGYGGESYAGKVDRKIYDYFKEKKIDIEQYAGGWGEFNELDPNFVPFPEGSPYECDNLWHASGAELSQSNLIIVEDENRNTVWEHNLDYGDLTDAGVTVTETGGYELIDCDENDVVFYGGQGEKGGFFDAEFTLTQPFDPKKLKISYENCDDWYIITGVEYDGKELDGCDGYSTTGKWSEYKWILFNGEEVYKTTEESISFSDGDKTNWFDKAVKPIYQGQYEVTDNVRPEDTIFGNWTGHSWKDIDGNKIKIKSWRGLKFNPNKA